MLDIVLARMQETVKMSKNTELDSEPSKSESRHSGSSRSSSWSGSDDSETTELSEFIPPAPD
eukprot:6050869-Karenia_brevis.AAC.1